MFDLEPDIEHIIRSDVRSGLLSQSIQLVQVSDEHACTSVREVREECDLFAFVETYSAEKIRADG
jgi:hypothetical protein